MGSAMQMDLLARRECLGILILLLTVMKGLSSETLCQMEKKIRNPTLIRYQQFGSLYNLEKPTNSNATNCTWMIKGTSNYLLNVLFINSSFARKSSGSNCGEEYIAVHQYDTRNKTWVSWRPYCGQRELPDIRINGNVRIQLNFRKSNLESGTNLWLTIYAELSSKDCGGVFDESSSGIPISYNARNVASGILIHCVWFLRFSSKRSVNAIPSIINLKPNYNKCSYYKEMFSVRKWNDALIKFEDKVVQCGRGTQLPRIYNTSMGNRFALTMHSESCYDERFEAIYMPTSKENSKQTSIDGFYQENYNFTASGEVNGLSLVKSQVLKRNRIYLMLHDMFYRCEGGGILEIWSMSSSNIWQKNKTISIFQAERATLNVVLDAEKGTVLVYFRLKLSTQPMGFKVSYFTSSKICGGVYHLNPGENAIIKSPMDSSGEYPKNTYCRWMVFANNSTNLNISTVSMDLEHHRQCGFDYVEISGGYESNDISTKRFCKPLKESIIFKGIILFYFHSDFHVTKTGFEISVNAQGSETAPTTPTADHDICSSSTTSRTSTSSPISTTKKTSGDILGTTTMMSSHTSLTLTPTNVSLTERERQTGTKTEIAGYLIGIITGLAAIAFAASVAVVILRRRKLTHTRENNKIDGPTGSLDRQRQNSSIPLVDMDNLRKPSMPENAYAEVIKEKAHDESEFAMKQAENPYYATNSDTLQIEKQDMSQEMTNPYYAASENGVREPVYACADVVENVYAEPSSKRPNEYSYAQAPRTSFGQDGLHKTEINENGYANDEYAL